MKRIELRIYHRPRDSLLLNTWFSPLPLAILILALCSVGVGTFFLIWCGTWYLAVVCLLSDDRNPLAKLTKTTISLDPENDACMIRVTPSLLSYLCFARSTLRRERLCDLTTVTTTTKMSHVSARWAPFDEDGRLLLDPRNGKQTHAKMKLKVHFGPREVPIDQYLSFEELQVLVDYVHEYHGWAVQTGLVEDLAAPNNFRKLLARRAETSAEPPHGIDARAPYLIVSESTELSSLNNHPPTYSTQHALYTPATLPPYASAPSLDAGRLTPNTVFPADPPDSLSGKEDEEPDVF
ncbi:hypothetical protein BLNAU_13680 [Blattamonas nauphoetae]|uniref:Uncharacterized protein n=1 Tax=Blattamonas nauphoetae TaxID=2049346 RepID=A0ABQ9XMP0_9EUKA|nr:hypothetical protein BLNAU_13680 [Blattamonas nauphoetae]